MEKVKILSNKQGQCPYCNSNSITYSSMELEDNMVYYPCTCDNCKRYFEEWYELNFTGHNVGSNGQHIIDDNTKEIIY